MFFDEKNRLRRVLAKYTHRGLVIVSDGKNPEPSIDALCGRPKSTRSRKAELVSSP
jgi:hypothetical protein